MQNYLITVKSLVKNDDGTPKADLVRLVPIDKLQKFVEEYVNQDAICIVAAQIEVYE